MQRISLSAGNLSIPTIGLGTWKAKPEEIEKAVEVAISAGYRHFDTAFNYNTEEYIGKALKRLIDEGVVKREDLFITTKLPVFGNRASDVERFIKMSLGKLKMDYVDLYLVHMPFSIKCDLKELQPAKNDDGTVALDLNTNHLDTWKAMEQQVKMGRTRAIGVSNFNIVQLRSLHEKAEIKPAVLQVEIHAYNLQKCLINACRCLNIAVTAYSPLGSPLAQSHFLEKYNVIREIPNLLEDPVVQEIANAINRTPGQVLLRHLLQQNIVVIPKSVNPTRIVQNISVFDFDLPANYLQKLDCLDKGEAGRIFDFLFFKGIECHPEYPFRNRLQIQKDTL